MRTKTVDERFAEKIQPGPNGCIEWVGASNELGYGRFSINNRMIGPHRYSYEKAKGPIPDGLVIDHLCRNPPCVNPDHLEAVTHAENVRRGLSPQIGADYARSLPPKTHCPEGHPYDEVNTYVEARGSQDIRHCRTCRNRRHREFRAKKRIEGNQP